MKNNQEIEDVIETLKKENESNKAKKPNPENGFTLNTFFSSKKSSQNLTAINLQSKKISFENLNILVSLLKENKTVTSLNLSNTGLGSKSGKLIGDLLLKNQTIIKLNLSENSLECEGVIPIFRALHFNRVLQKLNLRCTHIRATGAIDAAQCLKQNVGLKSLILYDNWFSNEGAQVIAQALQFNNSLQYIDLGYCDSLKYPCIKTIEALEISLASNRSLYSFDVYNLTDPEEAKPYLQRTQKLLKHLESNRPENTEKARRAILEAFNLYNVNTVKSYFYPPRLIPIPCVAEVILEYAGCNERPVYTTNLKPD